MDPNFKFFFGGVCNDTQPIYGLIDLIDNHFMVQSYSAELLFDVRELIKSKTRLEIVDISQHRYNTDGSRVTDNWVIEQWGVNVSKLNFRIDPLTSKRFASNNTKETYIANIPKADIEPVAVDFDLYKQDLQQQIFFIYFFVANNRVCDSAKTHFKKIVQCSSSYNEMLEKFLDVESAPPDAQIDLLFFLTTSGLIYE